MLWRAGDLACILNAEEGLLLACVACAQQSCGSLTNFSHPKNGAGAVILLFSFLLRFSCFSFLVRCSCVFLLPGCFCKANSGLEQGSWVRLQDSSQARTGELKKMKIRRTTRRTRRKTKVEK